MPLDVTWTDQRVKDPRKESTDISTLKWYGLWGAGHGHCRLRLWNMTAPTDTNSRLQPYDPIRYFFVYVSEEERYYFIW